MRAMSPSPAREGNAPPTKTDGAHYRIMDAAMDALWAAVKAARADGLRVHIEMTIEEDDDSEPEWVLWVTRKIGKKTP